MADRTSILERQLLALNRRVDDLEQTSRSKSPIGPTNLTDPVESLNPQSIGTDLLKDTPGCHLSHTTFQTVTPGVYPGTTALAYDFDRYNVGNMHNTSTNNSRITFPETGVYAVGFQVGFELLDAGGGGGGNIGYVLMRIMKNGTIPIARSEGALGGGLTNWHVFTNVITKFDANDYVEAFVWHSGGGPRRTVKTVQETPEAYAQWLAHGESNAALTPPT